MSDTLTWVDPEGTETTLGVLDPGPMGRFMPPIARVEEGIPAQPGASLRIVRHGPREIAVPIYVDDTDPVALRTALRNYARLLDPTRGDGRLRATGPGGDTRELVCRYHDGWGLEEQLDTFQRAVLVFRASDDPYWVDTADTTLEATTGEQETFFPIFPLTLSSSEVFAGFNVDNTGDVDAWPVWTVVGPGSSIVLRNTTTGKLLSLTNGSLSLAGGEYITIDTRPRRKSVTLGDGPNAFDELTAESSLWPLIPSGNNVQVEMTGATVNSVVRLSYRKRYLAP